jgi:hypothetical protein
MCTDDCSLSCTVVSGSCAQTCSGSGCTCSGC